MAWEWTKDSGISTPFNDGLIWHTWVWLILEAQDLTSVVMVCVAGAMTWVSPYLWLWGPYCSEIVSYFFMDYVHLYMPGSKLLLKLVELKAVITTTLTFDCQEGLGRSLYQPKYADPCNSDWRSLSEAWQQHYAVICNADQLPEDETTHTF